MQDLPSLTIRYSAVLAESEKELDFAAGPWLESGLVQAFADGIYFYRRAPGQGLLILTSWRGLPASLSPSIHVPLGDREQQWLSSLTDPEEIEGGACQNWRLE